MRHSCALKVQESEVGQACNMVEAGVRNSRARYVQYLKFAQTCEVS